MCVCVYVCQDRLFCMPFQIWTIFVDKSLQHNLFSTNKALAYQMDGHMDPALRHLVICRLAASLLGCEQCVLLMENPQGDTTTNSPGEA